MRKFIVDIPYDEKTCFVLGRKIVLKKGEIFQESSITQALPSFFKEIKENVNEVTKVIKEEPKEELLIDESSDVKVTTEKVTRNRTRRKEN